MRVLLSLTSDASRVAYPLGAAPTTVAAKTETGINWTPDRLR
jgi:hypothetical protein